MGVGGLKPRLLDLFSGAGGASVGYSRAGFEVVGVDIGNMKRYPFEFIRADVRDVLADRKFLSSFDAVTASPPCQTNSRTQHLRNAQGKSPGTLSLDMIPEVRDVLSELGRPYVIENVEGADMRDPITLCGSMFP